MSYNNDLGAAIGWDDELTAEEASFALLEPGDYPFVVESVARKQFDGSAKMAPCFIEELSLNIQGFTIEHALFLNTKFLSRISEFFVAIGQAQYGQKFRPNWTGLVGRKGDMQGGLSHLDGQGRHRAQGQQGADLLSAHRECHACDCSRGRSGGGHAVLESATERACGTCPACTADLAAAPADHHARVSAERVSLAAGQLLMELRPYQQEAREAVEHQWREVDRTLLVLPTGCGKTIVFASVTADRVSAGDRVLILAHRGELLEQAADKLRQAVGLGCAVEKAGESCLGSWYRVVVGSVQTLMREKRLEQFPPDYFGTIVIDEAHHAVSDSYRRILDHFSDAKVLGVTATPDRGDMRDLGAVFESLAYEYTLPRAIREGYLTPIQALTVPLTLDISGVSMQSGDFKASEIDTALDPYLEQIAGEMAQLCADRKTVVFLPLVKTSQKFRDILNAHGFRAAEVNGESTDRAEVLADFDAGKYNVLCNSMLLTEGWDCPSVDCVVVLRPTKVRGLYCQMVGRGTRLSPGKENLLLLDFLWMTERHELCHPASLICETEEVARRMTENLAGRRPDAR